MKNNFTESQYETNSGHISIFTVMQSMQKQVVTMIKIKMMQTMGQSRMQTKKKMGLQSPSLLHGKLMLFWQQFAVGTLWF